MEPRCWGHAASEGRTREFGSERGRFVHCKCSRLSSRSKKHRSNGHNWVVAFCMKPTSWWQQPAPRWWPSRPFSHLYNGYFIDHPFVLFTGFLQGNWLCCSAANPMPFTALGNGMKHFSLPRNVSSGIQPTWRYGVVSAGGGGGYPLPSNLPIFLA